MKKHILSQNVKCVFDTVKHILYSHSRPATQQENLRIKVPKTDDSVGVSIYTPNSQISQKSAQNGVPVGRPFRTFLVFFCTFWYLVSFWTLELPKWAPIFSPTRISHKLFLNWRPICYHFHDLGRPVGAKAPIVGFLVVDLALDKRWRGWAKPCGQIGLMAQGAGGG